MNDTTTIWAGISWAEVVGLVVIALLVVAVGWTMYQKWSGHTKSDVSGLHFKHHDHGSPPPT